MKTLLVVTVKKSNPRRCCRGGEEGGDGEEGEGGEGDGVEAEEEGGGVEVEDMEEAVEAVAEDEVEGEQAGSCILCLLTPLTKMQVCIYTNEVHRASCMYVYIQLWVQCCLPQIIITTLLIHACACIISTKDGP